MEFEIFKSILEGRTPKGRKVPKKYLTGDTEADKQRMKKEIDKHAHKDDNDSSAYVDWVADYKEGDTRGERHETKKSKATKKYEEMFGESKDAPWKKGLKIKAEETEIPYRFLKKVYDRGLAAWKTGHRPGVQQHQWAMGRVNSFVTGEGKSREADADIWSDYQKWKEDS
jgi:hypothetical protein